MSASGYPTNQASVLASVLCVRGVRIHEAEIIEGAIRRARVFGRAIPTEAAMREAIDELVGAGEIARNADGWIMRPTGDGAP